MAWPKQWAQRNYLAGPPPPGWGLRHTARSGETRPVPSRPVRSADRRGQAVDHHGARQLRERRTVEHQFRATDTGPDDLSLIHISEPTRRTPISYAVFCLKK